MARTSYAIALGSNRRTRYGSPRATVAAAFAALGDVTVRSPIIASAPIGPSIRTYANAVAIIETDETPPQLLARLKQVERAFGRRPGRRWGARSLDLDIILWSGGAWSDRTITIPHIAFRTRAFVLRPLADIATDWRDPISGLTVRQLYARVSG